MLVNVASGCLRSTCVISYVHTVMMFFNKGSLSQVVLCGVLTLGFLCTSAWYEPYASRAANLFKIGTKAALVSAV